MSRAGLNAILIENRAGLNAIDEWGHNSTYMSRAELNAKFGMLIIPRVQADNTNRAGMTIRWGIIVSQKCRNSMVWAVSVAKG